MTLFAHSNPQAPDDPTQWEQLLGPNGHLEAVETRIRSFISRTFRCQSDDIEAWLQLGLLIACWHDLGKCTDEYQQYLLKHAQQINRSPSGVTRPCALTNRIDVSLYDAESLVDGRYVMAVVGVR